MRPDTDRAVSRAAVAGMVMLVLLVASTALVITQPTVRERVREVMGWSSPALTTGSSSHLPSAWYAAHDRTLVIFASEACAACQQSRAFHEELRRVAADVPSLHVITALTGSTDDVAAYAATYAIPVKQVVRFDARGSWLRRIPSTVLVDRDGTVLTYTEGVLSLEEQHALLAQLKR
jgi:hypothetical protein